MYRLRTLLPLVLIAAAAALPTIAQEGRAEVPQAPRGLVSSEDPGDLFLVYTGDVIGYVDTCGCKRNPAGGLHRRSWLLSRMNELFPDRPKLILDSGNFSDNPTALGDVKTQALVEGMNRLGYHVANVGERELKTGWEDFVARTEDAAFPLISANIVREDTGKPVLPPHHVVTLTDADGTERRVGVIGVARYNPVFLKTGPDDSNLVMAQPVDRVREEVRALEKKGVDLIVLLAAMHKQDVRAVLREVPGIAVAIGSYGGVFTAAEEREGESLIVYSGNQGKRVGETRLFLDEAWKVERASTAMHFLTRQYPHDQEMLDYVNAVPADASALGGATATTR